MEGKITSEAFDLDGMKEVPTVRGTQINVAHENKFRMNFSEFPNLGGFEIDHQLITGYLKSFDFPEMRNETIVSTFLRQERHHPLDGGNRNIGQLNLTFNVSENYENYIWFRKFLWDLRLGRRPKNVENLVDYLFDWMDITMLDNKKRDIYTVKFLHVLPESVSSLPLNTTGSEELTFTVPFFFHDFMPMMHSVYN